MLIEENHIVQSLKNGGVVIFPTDTVYALSCDCFNIESIEKLYEIKRRKHDKTSAIIINKIDMIKDIIILNGKQNGFINRINYDYQKGLLGSGPVTFIVKTSLNEKENSFIVNNGNIAFRIPKHILCCNIIDKYNKPLLATSVNISNRQSIIKGDLISNYFIDRVDYYIKKDENLSGIESTIIDITSEKKINILRNGCIDRSYLFDLWYYTVY